jgi:hypothetical protein
MQMKRRRIIDSQSFAGRRSDQIPFPFGRIAIGATILAAGIWIVLIWFLSL